MFYSFFINKIQMHICVDSVKITGDIIYVVLVKIRMIRRIFAIHIP